MGGFEHPRGSTRSEGNLSGTHGAAEGVRAGEGDTVVRMGTEPSGAAGGGSASLSSAGPPAWSVEGVPACGSGWDHMSLPT